MRSIPERRQGKNLINDPQSEGTSENTIRKK